MMWQAPPWGNRIKTTGRCFIHIAFISLKTFVIAGNIPLMTDDKKNTNNSSSEVS